MSIVAGPDPKEVWDLEFSSLTNALVGRCDEGKGYGEGRNCLAVSNRYSRLYLGCEKELLVMDSLSTERGGEPLLRVDLPQRPIHVGLNSDETTLSVVMNPQIYIFDTRALETKDTRPFLEIPSFTPPGVYVEDFDWNPTVPSMFCATYSNGSLGLYIVSEDKADLCTLPPCEGAVCVSWSPKGKQLVVGKKDGSLTQYKPDLKLAKTVPSPPSPTPLSAVSILWISTYQFMVGYKNTSGPESRPGVFVVQAPKSGPVTYVNYDDVTFGSGPAASQKFLFKMITDWNIILCSSTSSVELAVFGGNNDARWDQWTLSGDRAEIPMKNHKDERYPIGMGISVNSQQILAKDETSNLPHPMPILFLLSADGFLCSFYMKNLSTDSKCINSPSVALPLEGMRPGSAQIIIPKAKEYSETKTPAPAVSSKSPVKTPLTTPSGFSFLPKTPVTPSFTLDGVTASGGINTSGFAQKFPVTTASTFGSLSSKDPAFSTSLGTSPSTLSTIFSPKLNTPTVSDNVSSPLNREQIEISRSEQSKPLTPPSSQHSSSNIMTKPVTMTSTNRPEKPSQDDKNAALLALYKKRIIEEKSVNRAIHAEMAFFDKEIEEFKTKASKIKIDIGTEEEKLKLRKSTEEVDKFCKDVSEITKAQTSEINSLQNLTLEGFDWIEEARSRHVRNSDPKYIKALRGRALDPLSQQKLDSVLSKYMYLDQQLREINMSLDIEWEEHQERNKKNRINKRSFSSSRDTIHKAIRNNHKILAAQKEQVEELVQRVNEISLKGGGFGKAYDIVGDLSSTLEKTVLSLKNSTCKKEEISPIITFSPKKEAALRQFFNSKNSIKIHSTRPKNLSESRFLKMQDLDEESNKSKTMIKALNDEPENDPSTLSFIIGGKDSDAAKPKEIDAIRVSAKDEKGNSELSVLREKDLKNSPTFSLPVTQDITAFGEESKNLSTDVASNVKTGIPCEKSFFGAPICSPFAVETLNLAKSSSTPISSVKPVITTESSSAIKVEKSSSTIPKFTFGSIVSTPETLFGEKTCENLGSSATITSTAKYEISSSSGVSFELPSVSKSSPLESVIPTSSSLTHQNKNSSTIGSSVVSTVSGAFTNAPTLSSSLGMYTQKSEPSITFNFGNTSSSKFEPSNTTPLSSVGSSSCSVSASSSASVSESNGSSVFGRSTSSITSSTSGGSIFGVSPKVTTSISKTLSSTTSDAEPALVIAKTTHDSKTQSLTVTAVTVAQSSASEPSSVQSIFGSTVSKTTEPSSSIFTNTCKSNTTSSSIFTSSSAPSVTNTSFIFVSSSPTPGLSPSNPLFGAVTTSEASATSTLTVTTSSGSGVFVGTPKPTYGENQKVVISSSVGNPTSSSTTSIFGKPASSGSSSIFGKPNAAVGTTSSVFGAIPSPSVFGSPSSSSTYNSPSGGVFNQTSSFNTTTSTTSVFGGGSSVFGGGAPSTSLFGGASTSPQAFSFGSTQSSSEPFASQPVFSQSSSASTTSTASASVFSSSTNPNAEESVFSGGSSGGGFFSGLGSSPNSTNANKNVFGSSSTFGSPNQSANLFGGGSTAAFGSQTPLTSSMGSGFSGGSVATPKFGSSKTSGGFGSAPAFGSSSSFGNTSSFSSATAFGSSTAFGSGTENPIFGSIQSEGSTGFGNVSTTGGDGFGSLAAQSSTNIFGNQAIGDANRKGSSFTAWRKSDM